MTCAARLKLNKPITSATALARMTRLRIYRPKPAESGPHGTFDSTLHTIRNYLWPRSTKHGVNCHNLVAHLSARHIFVSKFIFIFRRIAFSELRFNEFSPRQKICLILTRVSRSDYKAGVADASVGHDDLRSVALSFLKKSICSPSIRLAIGANCKANRTGASPHRAQRRERRSVRRVRC
jgi:hypothetical protein